MCITKAKGRSVTDLILLRFNHEIHLFTSEIHEKLHFCQEVTQISTPLYQNETLAISFY